jgi:ribosomal-protein-alanine acetyltransferase
MPVVIRSAVLNDVPTLLAIERQAPPAAHWTLEQYRKLVESGVVLVAEEAADQAPAPCKERKERATPGSEREEQGTPGAEREERGTLFGFLCAKAVAGEWEIENVVVAAEFLRRGIARKLVLELVERAKNGAASTVLLEVRESNRAARRLYEKCGFREVGCRRAYYANPVEDAILYALHFES